MIHLGFEVGSGRKVSVPLGHTIVCGQSQKSGKTTALEAMAIRSGRTVLAFVTKRGERSFVDPDREKFHHLPPYFQERADWRFVAATLESSMGEKLKTERAWIMRACRGARALSDVRANADRLQAEAKRGMDRDMFMMLCEYLDQVLPTIASLPPSSRTILLHRPNINVMDVSGWDAKMQLLFVASAINHVATEEEGVVTVVPEAWETLPERRNTPVKEPATLIARKGATVGNYLLLDSQDIAGVSKEIIRQATVWLLGVQREANEVRRVLEHIPEGLKKPKPSDVARLELGQFFACTPDAVTKVYVQPDWMPNDMAYRVAVGRDSASDIAGRRREAQDERAKKRKITDEPAAAPVGGGGGGRRRGEAIEASFPQPGEVSFVDAIVRREVDVVKGDVAALRSELGDLRKFLHERLGDPKAPAFRHTELFDDDPPVTIGKRKDGALVAQRSDGTTFVDHGRGPRQAIIKTEIVTSEARGPVNYKGPLPTLSVGNGPATFDLKGWTEMEEELYQKFKARLVSELRQEAPEILRLVATAPELEVEMKREIVEADGKTPLGMVARLLKDGHLDDYLSSVAAHSALQSKMAAKHDRKTTYNSLEKLVEMGFLFKNKNGYKAVPGMKVTVRETGR